MDLPNQEPQLPIFLHASASNPKVIQLLQNTSILQTIRRNGVREFYIMWKKPDKKRTKFCNANESLVLEMRFILILYNAYKFEIPEFGPYVEFCNFIRAKLSILMSKLPTTKPCKLGNEILLEIESALQRLQSDADVASNYVNTNV